MKRYAPLLFFLALAACKVGPNYKTPPAPVPPAFKESPPESFKEWKQAHPSDDAIRGKWWEIFDDPALNALEERVDISNQNVLAAEAQYRESRAAIRVARSGLFPSIAAAPATSVAQGSTNLGAGQVGSVSTLSTTRSTRSDFVLPFDLSYQADVWGSIRRGAAAAAATAEASAAQLENAKLSYQATLAQDYFSLHGLDSQQELLTKTVDSYRQLLDLTKTRYASGVASQADVSLAETQLNTTRAQLIDVGVQRAAFEHAIAILTGRPPAEYSAPDVPLTAAPPPIPVALPSELLERRPDIAASERQAAAANEQIGIARAAFFPTISLSAVAGLESSSILDLLAWPSRFWSLGPQAAETLFDAGRRGGQVQEAQAAYDAAVANYRQTVLAAFQQVEDNLAALRILDQESVAERQAIASAQDSLRVTTAQYSSGVADYLSVLTAQTAVFGTQTTAISILTRRMNSSVLLIEALGGGWNAANLPK